MDTLKINLPEKVNKIIQILQQEGFEAYAVGGCVRDSILGREPEDWDITTSAMPEEIKNIFRRTIDTGIEHGTVTVRLEGESFEVTTYRIDGEYEDSRHPKEVMFTRSLEEDLQRRDFTINAMAYNQKDGLVDIFDGLSDLRKMLIRCVGNAKERFSEDALRILRGVRFAAQLNFTIDGDTREGMRSLAPTLKNISAERIQTELVKMLVSDRPELLREAYELGITAQFLPEFDRLMITEQETPHHMYNVGDHTLYAMKNIRSDKVLRLTMLLHDMGKPALKTIDETGRAHFKKHAAESEAMARRILKRLKFDNDTLHKVCRLIRFHDYRMDATEYNVRQAINLIGEDFFPSYMEVRRADVLAQSMYKREEKLRNLDEIEYLYGKIMQEGQCVSLQTLAVSGKDLLEAGMEPGRQIGEKLEELLKIVLKDPKLNTKEELLKRL
ncbi:MAG TPA: CCA tRNA nucleotidyltransferase [Candidatus Dorea gallistercoris]|uniref:CCA tRNA nucleotidyltransferase n=1 Tax=Candidatus Dorea gallistercoris TaxID=2838542 RepID=A0A9D1RAT3_9FIRM|nr:CCA tRNA nucleotidyltransferase [Candidatus Dorea gallistercoris]